MKQDIGDITKPKFIWRHQYDQIRDKEEGDRAALRCEEESLTVQSFTEDADLNVLAKRFGITDIPIGPIDPRLFRDTTNDPDLREVLERTRAAKEYFMALPAKMRTRFHNNMGELWNFVTDPENAEEAVRLGLLTQPNIADAANSSTTSGSAPSAHATTKAPSPTASTENPPNPPRGPKETP